MYPYILPAKKIPEKVKRVRSSLWVADFETTVYPAQTYTEVWAAAICRLGCDTEQGVEVQNSIESFFDFLIGQNENMTVYFHNLKFDGHFILTYLMKNYNQAFDNSENHFKKKKEMENDEFSYLISSEGQWYFIVFKINDKIITFYDSLKLIPLSVKQIGDSFKTKHRKLSIEYEGYRKAGGYISPDERHYISNDVLVMSEALKIFRDQGYHRSTLASNAILQMKKFINRNCAPGLNFSKKFPEQDAFLPTGETLDEFIRPAYLGGWVYVNPRFQNRLIEDVDGYTLDVNSLFPYVMHSVSGNEYPCGMPEVLSTFEEFNEAKGSRFYFIRFKCSFEIKEGFLPFIQIKNNLLYTGTEMLTTSRIKNQKTGRYVTEIKNPNGVQNNVVELTMSKPIFQLFKKHYSIENFEFEMCLAYQTTMYDFDDYIEFYMKEKMTQEGGLRQIAKLFLNSAYGKFGTSPNSSFKIADLDDEGCLCFSTVFEAEKKTIYVPVAAAVTSYARCLIVSAAQENIDTFAYADTDSLHLINPDINSLSYLLDSKKLGKFKVEEKWNTAKFLRQKTYIEIGDDVTLKGAGITTRAKNNFLFSVPEGKEKLTDEDMEQFSNLSDQEKAYINIERTWDDFKIGAEFIGNLKPVRMPGGVVLTKNVFTVKGGRIW